MNFLSDAFKRAIAGVVRELDPNRDFGGFHEYRVIAGTGILGYELQPVSDGMPSLRGVKVWPAGSALTLFVPGSSVLVAFVNKNPGAPFIAFDGAIIRHGDQLGAVTLGAYIVQKTPQP